MQMARWFGYRPDYEDVCRVYLPQIALDHYEEINEAIEELRTEVRRMQDLGMTPEHFGLKVRESPTAIRITAANKMRSATQMTVAQDYSERHLEGYILANDQRVNLANLEEVKRFLAGLGEPSSAFTTDQAVVWRGVPGLTGDVAAEEVSPSRRPMPTWARSAAAPASSWTTSPTAFRTRWRSGMSPFPIRPAASRRDTSSPDTAFRSGSGESGDVVEGGFRVTGGRNRVAIRMTLRSV